MKGREEKRGEPLKNNVNQLHWFQTRNHERGEKKGGDPEEKRIDATIHGNSCLFDAEGEPGEEEERIAQEGVGKSSSTLSGLFAAPDKRDDKGEKEKEKRKEPYGGRRENRVFDPCPHRARDSGKEEKREQKEKIRLKEGKRETWWPEAWNPQSALAGQVLPGTATPAREKKRERRAREVKDFSRR